MGLLDGADRRDQEFADRDRADGWSPAEPSRLRWVLGALAFVGGVVLTNIVGPWAIPLVLTLGLAAMVVGFVRRR
ncbi:MAG: hypothetical protein JWN67_953 [Actinomycetia bacterium]|nr:hypothetical protein [Actinomycetes bacterium]